MTSRGRNVLSAHITGYSASGQGKGCYINGALRFADAPPVEGEAACWLPWRDLAARCEQHLRAAGIQAQQEQNNEGGTTD